MPYIVSIECGELRYADVDNRGSRVIIRTALPLYIPAECELGGFCLAWELALLHVIYQADSAA